MLLTFTDFKVLSCIVFVLCVVYIMLAIDAQIDLVNAHERFLGVNSLISIFICILDYLT